MRVRVEQIETPNVASGYTLEDCRAVEFDHLPMPGLAVALATAGPREVELEPQHVLLLGPAGSGLMRPGGFDLDSAQALWAATTHSEPQG
jgi:hypothetical protein